MTSLRKWSLQFLRVSHEHSMHSTEASSTFQLFYDGPKRTQKTRKMDDEGGTVQSNRRPFFRELCALLRLTR